MILSLLLACLPIALPIALPTQTIVQPFDFSGLDVLGQQEHPFVVQPFDDELGTLVDVRIEVEAFRLNSVAWITNTSDAYLPAQVTATGAGTVPWIHDSAGHVWPMFSFTSTVFPRGDHYWCVVPPRSAHAYHRFTDTDDLWCNGLPLQWGPYSMSLIYPSTPGLEYWRGSDPIELRFVPSLSLSVYLTDGLHILRWPGDYSALTLTFGMRYSVQYIYQ